MTEAPQTAVIGSGPNGLAAAIRLAQAGHAVTVYEGAATPGGGVRSALLTLPGFIHDAYAAVFPLATASPFFQRLDLSSYGLTWIEPTVPLAHPFDDGTAVALYRSVARTAEELGSDRRVYAELMEPLVAATPDLVADLLAPPGRQRHPAVSARFATHGIRSLTGFVSSYFHTDAARALFAGHAAHSFLRLDAPLTAGFALTLGLLGHTTGWPIAAGGAGTLTAALVSVLYASGGSLALDHPVRSLAELDRPECVLFDTDPRQLAAIAGPRLPARFRARLMRHRFGPGVFKLDYALAGPVPWTAPVCREAGTVHVGGSLEEIARSEEAVTRGRHPERPFVIVSQPSLFDPGRAPAGKQTLWAYCHVPAGSTVDMTERIERQIERFAPGFRDLILARCVTTPADLEAANPNLVGGAINGGLQDLRTYAGWALSRPGPYATPDPGIYRCSAATPPGGGVHGMCGFHAAELVLRRMRHTGEKRAAMASV